MKISTQFPITISYLLASCAAHADIVGGETVKKSDAEQNSTVALYSPSANGQGGALCTASIISKDTAVTAAHCIPPNGAPSVMLFGRDLHKPGVEKRPVVAARVNPAYRTRGNKPGLDQGDIAVVKIGGGLPAGYAPVPMQSSDQSIKKGEPVELSGYGISNSATHQGAGVLRKTEVTVSNPRKGKSEMILDQTHHHGACHGDSGGPAFVIQGGKKVLAGVTNRSYPNRAPDDCRHKVVYTKVAAYQPWIKKTEKELHSKSPRTFKTHFRAKKQRRKTHRG